MSIRKVGNSKSVSGSVSSGDSTSSSYTTSDGINHGLIVWISTGESGVTAHSSVTFDGTGATKVGEAVNGNHRVSMWFLYDPAVKEANVVATISGGTRPTKIGMHFTSWEGFASSTPFGTVQTATGSSTTPSVTVSSQSGDMVFDGLVTDQWADGHAEGANQNDYVNTNVGSEHRLCASRESGSTSVDMTWAIDTTGTWAIMAVAASAKEEAAWLGTWAKRRKITVAASELTYGSLSQYPQRLYLSAACGKNSDDVSDIFTELGENKLKIAVTGWDGVTELYTEIEYWDGAADKANLWVNVPAISNVETNEIYLYYDSAQADNTSHVGVSGSAAGEQAWNDGFEMVLHFTETSGDYLDSTNHDNDAISMSISSRTADGQISPDTPSFNGSGNYLKLAAGTLGVVEQTFEALVKADSTSTGYHAIFNHKVGTNWYQMSRNAGQFHFRWHASDTNRRFDFGTVSAGTWQYVAGSLWDFGNGYAYGYVDGSKIITQTPAGIPTAGSISSAIGTYGSEYWDGDMDELRISNGYRGNGWIQFTHKQFEDSVNDWGATETLSGGSYAHTVNAVGTLGKVNGVAVANITEVNTV